jgi:thiaminase/transcriptional activator TenA
MSYSATLLNQHTELWQKAANHPFAAALAQGNLPDEAFREYVIQDYIFCQAVKKTIALLVAKLPNKGRVWEKVEDEIAKQVPPGIETAALRSFRKDMNIADEEFDNVNLVTKGFCDYLVALAYQGSYKEILVALLAIVFVYEAWANKFADVNSGDSKIQKWIQIHRDRRQRPNVNMLRATIDEVRKQGKHLKPNRKHKEILKFTLMWEIAFWDSICNSNKYKWAV